MKLTGFVCQSQASTAVCIPGDPKCAIVPRSYANDRTRLINPRHSSYHSSESRRFSLDHRRSVSILERTDQNSASTTRDKASLISADRVFQVVVMKVSLHCQGCAGKVRKHISKMEGVTSFSVDLEKKKVTVMGHISPEYVLESVSKVKKAELWPISKQSI